MSLPPGFLDELKARLSLSAVVGKKVVWDPRKSNQGKGDFWAPCPFHQEKTASFHVDDRQGFYYCFGCHAKGDAVSFVKETENVSFIEAVEILARDAGMQMPERDPRAQEQQDHRTKLAEVMEQAVQFYRLQLKTAAAAEARAYLDKRGLTEKTRERFEMGFAPDNRTALTEALKAKGVKPELILEAGLAAEPEGGGAPYDRFRGRIIFPIRDARGRAIALGGRAMDPNARAKYLNSPETPLFDKGRSLYNHGPAREAAGKGQPLVVAEGYVDVIALVEAGFEAAVAPLGTAITEDQLRLMWRIHPEPVIALDGDTAGLRAAMRVIDIALPLIEAGQSLRFAIMPEGLDPDDLIRQRGRQAMADLIGAAKPMVDLLWQRETEGRDFDSPERKAALDKDLRAALAKIRDPSIRTHYEAAIRDFRQALFRPARPQGGRFTPRQPAILPAKASTLAQAAAEGIEDHLREAVILATLTRFPALIERFESALERHDFAAPGHAQLQALLLAGQVGTARDDMGAEAYDRILKHRYVVISPTMKAGATPEVAEMCLTEEFAKLAARRGNAREIAEAALDLEGLADEGVTWHLAESARALDRAIRAERGDTTHYDRAENGVEVSRDDKARADEVFGSVRFEKGRG